MDQARKAWGCDAPAEHVVFEVTCSTCGGGSSLEVGSTCDDCDGSGVIGYKQCPTAILAKLPPWERSATEIAIRAYVQYDTRNVMPVQGGYVEQSSFFGVMVDLIDSERGKLETMLEDKRAREKKVSEIKAQREGSARGGVHRPPLRAH